VIEPAKPSTGPQPTATPNEHGIHLPFHLRSKLGLLSHLSAHDVNELAHDHLPAWLRPTQAERCWPIHVAVIAAIVLQLVLPAKLSLPPRALLPALEMVLLAVLMVANPVRLTRERALMRVASNALVALMTLANGASAVLLADRIINSRAGTNDPIALLVSGGSIYLTNVIAFALWYWEHDRGGPFARTAARRPHPDFLFPQMASPELAPPDWEPRFADYLYLSFTNATAFSPTDTLPLSRWAKMLMAAQSAVSLTTVALVVARAVNILK
jgi:uncharacterized membrane protein